VGGKNRERWKRATPLSKEVKDGFEKLVGVRGKKRALREGGVRRVGPRLKEHPMPTMRLYHYGGRKNDLGINGMWGVDS